MIHNDLQKLEVSVHELQLHPRNVRQGDVGAIAESLKQNGQYRPIVVQKSTGYVLAGNHTLKAAKALGWETIAATFVDVDNDAALRILLVDNHANDLAHYDETDLSELLKELTESERGLEGTGYDVEELDDLLRELEDPKQINTSQYEIVGDEPDVAELVNMDKVNELYASIAEQTMPDEIRNFLNAAAWRHAKFDYKKIAEFYAHQTPEVQRLMEQSVLIIIDVEDETDNGYTKFSQTIEELKNDTVPKIINQKHQKKNK